MNSQQNVTETESAHLMLDCNDEEKDQNSSVLVHTNRRQCFPLSRATLAILLTCTSLASILLFGFMLHILRFRSHQQPSESSLPLPGTQFGSCGDTPSSARQSNCTFDIMSFSWLPSPCADPELTAEFAGVRNWTWWLDTDKATAVSLEEVSRGDHTELFVTREYHMYHCTYMWRKLHKGLLKSLETPEKRGIVDTYIGKYGHTSHCEMMLLGMEEDHGTVQRNVTDTAIVMKFPRCMWT